MFELAPGFVQRGRVEVLVQDSGWDLLLGKPVLEAFRAVHEYESDTITIWAGADRHHTLSNALQPTVPSQVPTAALPPTAATVPLDHLR